MAYFPQGAIIIYPETVAQGIADGVDKVVTRRDNLEKQIAINTLPSKYWPSEFDKGPYLRDETWMQFIKWRMAGEKDQTVEYVKAPKSVGIMIPVVGRYHPANIVGTTLYDSVIELNIRDVGKYLSLEHNFRQHLMDYIKSSEGQQLAAFLNKSGYKAEDIDYIAIGFVPEKAIYGVGRLPNGKVVIYAHKDSYKKIANEAEGFGMEVGELREVAIGEEMAHIFRRSRPSITEEEATKTMLKEFYETLAKTTSNPKLKAKYARIIEHLEHDISTISRYAKINSNSLQDLVDLYYADIGELVSFLEGKALYEGINTEKGIAKYVSEKLEKIAKAAEKGYSGKDEVIEEDLGAKIFDSAEKTESVDGENAEGVEGCAAEDGGGEGGDGGGNG